MMSRADNMAVIIEVEVYEIVDATTCVLDVDIEKEDHLFIFEASTLKATPATPICDFAEVAVVNMQSGCHPLTYHDAS